MSNAPEREAEARRRIAVCAQEFEATAVRDLLAALDQERAALRELREAAEEAASWLWARGVSADGFTEDSRHADRLRVLLHPDDASEGKEG